MEVFLLLIDEMEDAVYTLAHVWVRLCRACLSLGLISSIMLLGSRIVVMDLAWVAALTAVASICVGLWAVPLVSILINDRRQRTHAA